MTDKPLDCTGVAPGHHLGKHDFKPCLPAAAQEAARGVEVLADRVRALEHALKGNDALIRDIRHRDARWHDDELVTRVLDANAALLGGEP